MHDKAGTRRLLVVVADGVRPDILRQEIERGSLPELARLMRAGALHTVSTSFPSVTGPAYTPFVMGRHPAAAGLIGLRWFDRSRTIPWSIGQSRSYAGMDIWRLDADIDRDIATVFELAPPSLAGMMMIGRGATAGRVGRGLWWSVRATMVHYRGSMMGWLGIERAATNEFLKRFAAVRPRLSMLAIATPDKFSHAYGYDSPQVRSAIQDVDNAIARARAIADAGGWGDTLHVWVVSDHGHAAVSQHDDLHGWLNALGHRVIAHPRLHVRKADVALMVSGNAMAQLYLEPERRARTWWPALENRWQPVLKGLLQRPSVDLVAVAISAESVRVHHATRGVADITRIGSGGGARWDYLAHDGDPLALGGTHTGLDEHAAWEAAQASPYPDSLLQLSTLVPSARSGDMIVSAAVGWDLRSRFEPMPHVSTHGALLREQMEVPLLLDVATARAPQRTTDIVPSALALLGIDAVDSHGQPLLFDGRSFLT